MRIVCPHCQFVTVCLDEVAAPGPCPNCGELASTPPTPHYPAPPNKEESVAPHRPAAPAANRAERLAAKLHQSASAPREHSPRRQNHADPRPFRWGRWVAALGGLGILATSAFGLLPGSQGCIRIEHRSWETTETPPPDHDALGRTLLGEWEGSEAGTRLKLRFHAQGNGGYDLSRERGFSSGGFWYRADYTGQPVAVTFDTSFINVRRLDVTFLTNDRISITPVEMRTDGFHRDPKPPDFPAMTLTRKPALAEKPKDGEKPPAREAGSWESLFDSKTTSGWKTTGAVRVEKGVLVLGGKKEATARTAAEFGNCELSYEYRIRQPRLGFVRAVVSCRAGHIVDDYSSLMKQGQWARVTITFTKKRATAPRWWAEQKTYLPDREGAYSTSGQAVDVARGPLSFGVPANVTVWLRNIKVRRLDGAGGGR